jgi:nucleotide sugar dehydrogenase
MSRVVRSPSSAFSSIGGTANAAPAACEHREMDFVSPWRGEPGTTGTVAVIGAGKMGLTLVGQFATHGWRVVAVDVRQDVVDSINAGQAHIDEPGLATILETAHAERRLRATLDAADAARVADVVVLIVPVMLDDVRRPDYGFMDSAVDSILAGVHAGQTVIFETTLPVGDTRNRYLPRLESGGLIGDVDVFVAFSPERLYSGDALRNLATYPKLVGGIGPASTARAAAFYASVLDSEVVAMSSAEAAEMAKLAETTYRDVNIALANEFARYSSGVGVDVREVIAAANSQPYSHIHQPGIGVGGHCIPVYPNFLLSRGPALSLVALAREINDGQVKLAIEAVKGALGGLRDARVLVLGLTYRAGVKELAYSQGPELVAGFLAQEARVEAYDPLLNAEEIAALDATPYAWGSPSRASAIVTQTADPQWSSLDASWFSELRVLFDGRNSLADLPLPAAVAYTGVGVIRSDRRS